MSDEPKPKCAYCSKDAVLDVRGPGNPRPPFLQRLVCVAHHERALRALDRNDGHDANEISEGAARILAGDT